MTILIEFPYENVAEEEVTQHYIEHHISMREKGYYCGSYPDIAAALGYTIYLNQFYEITQLAEYATMPMVHAKVFGPRMLNPCEQKAFDEAYSKGATEGLLAVSKNLYELATLGDFKAIDKFLEVRNAYDSVQASNEAPVQISLDGIDAEDEDINLEDSNVINFPQN